MRPGSFKPSHGPGLFTTRAVLSGSADNISINSATVIAPSPKVTPERPSLPPIRAAVPAAGTFVRPPTRPGKWQSTMIHNAAEAEATYSTAATLCVAAVELPLHD